MFMFFITKIFGLLSNHESPRNLIVAEYPLRIIRTKLLHRGEGKKRTGGLFLLCVQNRPIIL